jgi:uncharacterized protein
MQYPGPAVHRPVWKRVLWVIAGAAALFAGIVGIFLPLLPTTPFVLVAAFCFARGSERCEQWLMTHPRFGPMVRNWRDHRAIPLRVKQLAWATMAFGSAWGWFMLPANWRWAPALICALVALWLWRLPNL